MKRSDGYKRDSTQSNNIVTIYTSFVYSQNSRPFYQNVQPGRLLIIPFQVKIIN